MPRLDGVLGRDLVVGWVGTRLRLGAGVRLAGWWIGWLSVGLGAGLVKLGAGLVG